jgi:transglutaminase-like putative cysteine protease
MSDLDTCQNLIYNTGEVSATTDMDSLGHGVCRDFAHVGIAACAQPELFRRVWSRSYLHGLQPMDRNAWFDFTDGRWYI